MSEVMVVYGEVSVVFGRIVSSGATGRRAVARCGAVLLFVIVVLGGE